MISFTRIEEEYLYSMEECRVATSHDDIPHVKPVSYIFEDGLFPHQIEGFRKINTCISNATNNRGQILLPTGSGKSRIIFR